MPTGGLRMGPASPDLWACLGTCAASSSVREYALSRSLALDPKRAPCWAALGRLYTEAGHTSMADRCLTAARSHDPSSAAAWEAMGTLASFSAHGMRNSHWLPCVYSARHLTSSMMQEAWCADNTGLQALQFGGVVLQGLPGRRSTRKLSRWGAESKRFWGSWRALASGKRLPQQSMWQPEG